MFGLMALSWALFQSITLGIIEFTGFKFDPAYLKNNATQTDLWLLKLLQAISTLGTFLLPAMVFVRIKKPGADYLKASARVNPLLVLLVFIGFICFMPAMEQVIAWNESIQFPEGMKSLETLFRNMEERAKEITMLLVRADSIGALLLNILVLAIAPAIAEEFLFRGVIQNLLADRLKNKHVAIWIAAALFSLFHFQFYGFIPRLLFGALFGYLLMWSKSIWYPVLCHALNNSIAVVSSYIYTDTEPQLLPGHSGKVWLVTGGLILGSMAFYLFFRQQKTLQKPAGS